MLNDQPPSAIEPTIAATIVAAATGMISWMPPRSPSSNARGSEFGVEQRLARHLEPELEQTRQTFGEMTAAAEQHRGAGEHDGRHRELARARHFAAGTRVLEAFATRLLGAVVLRCVVVCHGS